MQPPKADTLAPALMLKASERSQIERLKKSERKKEREKFGSWIEIEKLGSVRVKRHGIEIENEGVLKPMLGPPHVDAMLLTKPNLHGEARTSEPGIDEP